MKVKKSDLRGKKKVKFSFQAEPGKDVSVAGSFNDWQPGKTKLESNGSGSYAATLQLPVGRYEYKFIVDSEWCMDPSIRKRSPMTAAR
jgi:1,4-alpha-glucan branching enzyme